MPAVACAKSAKCGVVELAEIAGPGFRGQGSGVRGVLR